MKFTLHLTSIEGELFISGDDKFMVQKMAALHYLDHLKAMLELEKLEMWEGWEETITLYESMIVELEKFRTHETPDFDLIAFVPRLYNELDWGNLSPNETIEWVG